MLHGKLAGGAVVARVAFGAPSASSVSATAGRVVLEGTQETPAPSVETAGSAGAPSVADPGALQSLVEMGFTEEKATEALLAMDNDVGLAADRLIAQG